MDDLGARLQTFVDWPQHVAVKPKHLAEAGFYYVGEGPNDDTVCCFACRGTVNRWKAGDVPEVKHRERLGESCPLAQRTDASANASREYDPINDDVMESEQQRLRSFQRNNGWPSAVDPRKLAAAGFYFTGVGDNVKCFACDVCLSRWEAEDDPISEHLRNQSDCLFLSRLIASGVSDNHKEYQYSQSNYMETLKITNNKPHHDLGQSGFISGAVILPEQNHTHNGPRRGLASEPMGPQRQGVSGSVPPNYANEHTRLHSFINWPKECPVRPKELIDAGFYYTGEEDKAQCFKCNVILAGWEPEDTPWGEHERWSKNCPLVKERLLRRKSPHSSLCENTESLRVPKEQTWLPPKEDFSGRAVNSGPCESGYLQGEATKPSRLPKEQGESEALQDFSISKKKLETTGEVFHIQKAVHELLEHGYDLATVEEAIKHKQKVCGETIDSTDDLRDAINMFMGMKSTCHPKENEHATADEHVESLPDPKPGKSSDSHSVSKVSATGMSLLVDPETIHQQFERMQEVHTCSICFDAQKGVVFLPCGHLVCCPKCAAEIQSKPSPLCPVCRTRIENRIQIYCS